MNHKHPTKTECLTLLEQYHTPPHVVRHCIAVTDTALKIANALNQKGYNLNLELIQGAGLIHDIARVEEQHWEVGSQIAKAHGYDQEAEIIKVHMFYPCFSDIDHINETDLVCLGDRLVKEDQYVGLDKRIDYVIAKVKAQGHGDAEKRILEKKKEARKLIDGIEQVIGQPLDQLME